MKAYLALLLTLFLYSCGIYPSTPMPQQVYPAATPNADHLIILLAGAGASATYFADHKWIDMAHAQGVDADFIAPYAHIGYYMSNNIVTRLEADVIMPARQKGYKFISIVGISMGGLGAVLCSRKMPQLVDRIYLIAPYLGKAAVHDAIEQDGDLQHWQITDEQATDWNYLIWQRLQEIIRDPAVNKKIFLGYGDEDEKKGHRLLAAALPKQNVFILPGGHKDVVFTAIWQRMLQQHLIE